MRRHLLITGILLIGTSLPVLAQCVPPHVTTQPQSVIACVGDSVEFTVTTTGSPHDFVWHKDGFDIPGPNGPTLKIERVTHADAGVYTVEVDNACGMDISAPAVLTVNDPPLITQGPADVTACTRGSATFSVAVAGAGPHLIEWATPRSGGVYGPPNATTLTLYGLTPDDKGAIAVRVSNGCHPPATAQADLTILASPMLVEPPEGGATCPGGSIVLDVTASGSPPLTFQWFKDGVPIQGATLPVFQIASAGSSDTGAYHVEVINACGHVDSVPVPVQVTPASERSWAPLGNGTSAPVFALQSFDDGGGPALFVGGNFHFADGVPVFHVAKWIGGQWLPVGGGMDGAVHFLGVFDLGAGPALYAAGEFTVAGGISANRIAKWDGTAWAPVGPGIDNGVVRTLHVYDDGFGMRLYAGGSFLLPGPLGGLAMFDGVAWTPVGGGVDGSVHALEAFDDGAGTALFVGGSFQAGGLVPAARMVRWTAAGWSAIGGGSPPAMVRTMLVYDPGSGAGLYVGGDFQGWNGINGIGRWDGSSWLPLAEGLGPGPVYALAQWDDGTGLGLYAGGNFTMSGFDLVNRIARWKDGAWTGLQMGRDDLVRAIAPHVTNGCEDLFTGGFFMHAGGIDVNFVARWKARFTLDLAQPLGPASFTLTNAFGDPGANVFTAFSLDPANESSPGAGPWFGMFITLDDLIGQYLLGFPPFVDVLDTKGMSFFALPPSSFTLMPGTHVWAVTVMYDPVLLVPGQNTLIDLITVR
jgi:hypothetical protein